MCAYPSPPVPGAIQYSWYTSPSGGSALGEAFTNVYSYYARQTTDLWVSCTNGSCVSPRTKVSAIVYPAPIIAATNDGVVDDGVPVKLSISNYTYDSYTWISPTGEAIPGATEAYYLTDVPGTYKVVVTKGAAPAYTSPEGFVVTTRNSELNQNYIVENVFLRTGISGTTDINLLKDEEVSRSFQYFDDLGRPIQRVIMAGVASKRRYRPAN